LFFSINVEAFEFRGFESGDDISSVVPKLEDSFDEVVEVEKGKVYLAFDIENGERKEVSTFLFECRGKLNGGNLVISNNMPLDGYVRWVNLLSKKYGDKSPNLEVVERSVENKSIKLSAKWVDGNDSITLELESHKKYNPILTLEYYDKGVCTKP